VTGEAKELPLRPVFDRRIKLEFHSAKITSDGEALGVSITTGEMRPRSLLLGSLDASVRATAG
jgi:hypothetical protein